MAMQPIQVTLTEAAVQIEHVLRANLVPILTGPPGLGKSAMYRALADALNLELIDIRLTSHDPADMAGYPMPNRERGRTEFLPVDMIPLEDDELPKGKDGWLVLFDELTSISRTMQAAAYKVLLDRMVGQRRVHSRVRMAAAGNRETDNAIAEQMGTALQSRLVHFEARSDLKSWLNWAERNDIDWRITSFLRFRPDLLNNFDPDHEDKTFACERTWDFLNRMVHPLPKIDRDLRPLVAGTVGQGPAMEFIGYQAIQGQVATYEDVVKNPVGAPVPDEPSAQFAVSGMLASSTQKADLERVMTYVQRLPGEFQFCMAQAMFRRNPDYLDEPSMLDWLNVAGEEFF